ncbi:HAD family hydrolase [Paenibacillus sp. YIM B09110]|uniref:HAD family hydrolase n=1 Tax=Paenibacillus sp. YIM B09110 TaxID=3126102 RepID=UPI00301BA523
MTDAVSEKRTQLVLDIGGVLATNLSPTFWHMLAEASELAVDRLYAVYKQQISKRLWTGQLAETDFWEWLQKQLPSIDTEEAKQYLAESLTALPAMDKIAVWSDKADLHILSNHVAEWVNPILEPVRHHFSTVTVSSDVGMKKPSDNIFVHVHGLLGPDVPILFVDDHPANLRQAEQHGWQTLLADQDGQWINKIAALL